jgi:superfamily II DNA or RNA helicase
MKLSENLGSYISRVLEEFSYHPFIAPYLEASRENPPQHYLHQHEVLARLAFRRPVRVLIGDEIGLGKTITALEVSRYMERLGRASRILIIVPRVLVGQWRKELIRMGIPEIRIMQLERETIGFWRRQGFPSGYYIASMDLLKKRERIADVADAPWDLVIVDEAHKFGMKTRRFMVLGKRLVESKPRRDVLFLSATPHRGDPRDYISRLQLLDPYLVEGWRELDRRSFYEATHGSILFRRTKEEINRVYEGREVFPPARFYACVIKARDKEAAFVNRLVRFLRSKLIEFAYERGLLSERVIPLLTVLVFKRASSSPYAAMTTLQRMLAKRAAPALTRDLIASVESYLSTGFEDYEYPERDPEEVFNEFLEATSPLLTERDREEVEELRDMARDIMEAGDSKLSALVSILEDVMAEEGSKVIVFTEYKDTLDYIVQFIRVKHPEWSGSILRLSSEETRDPRTFERIRRTFEDPRSKARILLATDVVSEGVNLQVAHIMANYEIPWSLMKMEQRLGRVWRLGQRKAVEAYTLFMENVADWAALNSMYSKLLNLKRAELSPRPVTGQEVLLYAEAEDLTRVPPPIAVRVEKGKKKFYRVTEARAIQTYLRRDEAGLEGLIASIIAARYEIERELSSKGVLYRPKTRSQVEASISLLGFRDPETLLDSMFRLVEASSDILGFKAVRTSGGVRILTGSEMPITLDSLGDIYGFLTRWRKDTGPLGLISYGESSRRVVLVPVLVRDGRDGATLYRELMGVDADGGSILRGSELLSTFSKALSGPIGVTEPGGQELEIPITSLSKLMECLRRVTAGLLEPLNLYMGRLSSIGLRGVDKVWARPGDLKFEILSPIGAIRFVEGSRGPTAVPEDIKRRVEEAAVEFVMDVERREGRTPAIVSEREHYDIRSVNPETGEVRIIEVKGHSGAEVYGELSEEEARLAREGGDSYWLYIVYGIGSGKPELLRFRNPLESMSWRILERIEKRYILHPRDVEDDGIG